VGVLCISRLQHRHRHVSIGDVVQSNGARVAGYSLVGFACLLAASRESMRVPRQRWRGFWYLTAAILGAIAVGRATGFTQLVTQLGRTEARRAGWYETRRGLQAVFVCAVAVTWTVAVFIAIMRVPERRRRFLPPALAAFTIVCFAVVRLASLHYVDVVLYQRDAIGVPVVVIIDWLLIALMAATIHWASRT
jgi:hypothetical protein